jgi:hypothetical protein
MSNLYKLVAEMAIDDLYPNLSKERKAEMMDYYTYKVETEIKRGE